MLEFVLFYYQWTSIIYWSKLFFDMSKSKLTYFTSSNLLYDLPSGKYMFSKKKKKLLYENIWVNLKLAHILIDSACF